MFPAVLDARDTSKCWARFDAAGARATVTFSRTVTVLSAPTSIAGIPGAILIVLRMRWDAKRIETTLKEARSKVPFSLLERIRDT